MQLGKSLLRLLVLLPLLQSSGILAAPFPLSLTTTLELSSWSIADRAVVDLPIANGALVSVELQRVSLYAPGAGIWRMDRAGRTQLRPGDRLHFLGRTPDGSTRLGFSLDPRRQTVRGLVSGPWGELAIEEPGGSGSHRLTPVEELTPAEGLESRCGNEALPIPWSVMEWMAVPSFSPRLAGAEPTHYVTIAIDTDNEWLDEKFANSEAAATAWIEDLFVVMNVLYERDLALRLFIGDTFLRRDLDMPPTYDDDPWTVAGSGASSGHLNEFGSFWSTNMGATSRAFAMLLSGKSSSDNSSSGIAWLDGYCETQSTGGGYSVTQTFGPGIPVSNDLRVIAHELGHNLGSPHTHCYSPPVDQCYASEGGCYASAVSCPGGPGTLMSYCHFSAMNGGAGCGSNLAELHPTVVGLMTSLRDARTPACVGLLAALAEIFADGFESGSTAAWAP